jgi:hypothetical protein
MFSYLWEIGRVTVMPRHCPLTSIGGILSLNKISPARQEDPIIARSGGINPYSPDEAMTVTPAKERP